MRVDKASGSELIEGRLKKALDEKDEKELKKACADFEGVFMKIIYNQMNASTINEDNFMEQSSAYKMYKSMLNDELAEKSAKAGGIGLGDMLFKQLRKDMVNKYKSVT